MARLTTKFVENVKPAATRREIPDAGCRGLYLIVQPTGRKVWAVRYRFEGATRKLTLNAGLTLAAARKAATTALHELESGNDPAAARAEAKINAAAARADTVTAICEAYLKREGYKLRTVDQRVSILKRLIYPVIGDRPVESLKRSDIVRLLDRIEDGQGQRAADVTLSVLRRVFNWHALRSDSFIPPIVRGMGRQNAKDHRRSRILDDGELRRVWLASTAEDAQPFGALIRFLLLTAARRSEAAGMRWDEVAHGVWTLPARRSKNKTDVPRPLCQAAQALLNAQPRYSGCEYVFTNNGTAAIQSFSGAKKKLDNVSGVTGWRLHDLRRTARSLLSRAGIHPDLAERCLGHAIGGVRGVYDRHQYVDEMRHAFEALAALIARLVSGMPADVVPLSARR